MGTDVIFLRVFTDADGNFGNPSSGGNES